MMSSEIIFLVCVSLIVTICVKAEDGSGSGSDLISVESVAETTTNIMDSMLALENTQGIVTVLGETTVMNSLVSAAIPHTPDSTSTSSVLISQSQQNTTTPAQFVTSLLPEMMTTMVKTTPITSVSGTISSLQKNMATTSASTVVLPASLSSSTVQESPIIATDSLESILNTPGDTMPAPPSSTILGTEIGSSEDKMMALSSRISPTMLLSSTHGSTTVSSFTTPHIVFSTSQRPLTTMLSTTIVPTTGADQRTRPITTTTPADMVNTLTESEGDATTSNDGLGTSEGLSTGSILLIVLGIILFLIILFLTIICVLVGLLCKSSKDSVKDNILNNWEVKHDAPSQGGVQLMKIRTLDEEPENRITLRELGALAEMGTQAMENSYEMGVIINERNTACTIFGVATGIDETVPNTAVTFGVATGIDETVPNTAVTFGVATTNENEGTKATVLEAVEEINVFSEVAATNPSKTTGSENDGAQVQILNDETGVGHEEEEASGTACASALEAHTTVEVDDENRDPIIFTGSAGSTDHKEMNKTLSAMDIERALFGGSSIDLEDVTTEL